MLLNLLKNNLLGKAKTDAQRADREEYYENRIHLGSVEKWIREKNGVTAAAFQPKIFLPAESDFCAVSLSRAKRLFNFNYKKCYNCEGVNLSVLFVKDELFDRKAIMQLHFKEERPVYLSYEISAMSIMEEMIGEKLQHILEHFMEEPVASTVTECITRNGEGTYWLMNKQWMMGITCEFKLFLHFIRLDEDYADVLKRLNKAGAVVPV
ncbi:hypothetical protein [Deminuibacter soli]|uniref:Uncharacterized protein n=1 Tax=Deminuibacter soli TaxID=2291815 RepID=A0A3E1NKY0_9BACT|nr:hypothetical protein [Deminuibacter soli]RFM28448.1 hypothetical protein DXN05_06465 [Deminuibacter soli]